MKRILPFAVLLLTLAQPSMALALAGGPTLTAQSSAATVAVNGAFTVTIQLDAKTYKVTAADVRLTYPADKLEALSVASASLLPKLLSKSTGSGTANIAVGVLSQATQGTGPVMVVTFKALAAGSATIGFASQTQVAAESPASTNVVGTMTPVTVTIGGVQATASAQASASPAATSSPVSASSSPASSPAGAAAGASRSPTPRPSSAAQSVSRVPTGPIETTLVAIILGSIATLLYVGYMGSDAFRRNEAKSIAAQEHKHDSDFRDSV
jgi:hypothetical protein